MSRVFLSLDLFQSQSTWRVDEANASLASPVGAISSILLSIVLLAYTALKVDTFVNKKAVDIKVSEISDYYDSTVEFSANEGFNVAFAVEKFNGRLRPNESHYSFNAYIEHIYLNE